MSRSFKKTPAHGLTGAASEKSDKRIASGAKRASFRVALSRAKELDDVMFDERNIAHSNAWDFAKDGRYFFEEVRVKRAPMNRLMFVGDPFRTTRCGYQFMGK